MEVVDFKTYNLSKNVEFDKNFGKRKSDNLLERKWSS